MHSRFVLSCCALIALGALAVAQKSNIVAVPAPRTSATSGKEMYMAYCATCHGREGKGDGPVAGALKTHPTDLTRLSERDQGRFPSVQVVNVISLDYSRISRRTPGIVEFYAVAMAISRLEPKRQSVERTLDNNPASERNSLGLLACPGQCMSPFAHGPIADRLEARPGGPKESSPRREP